ncbi:hypothetical protein [Actinoplanes palleronii]|uniref:Secreted protein n=1 Tax=Actinoplanes palleronii TaxID=113570 RepID=A0ABQ4B8P2_9ACTN|nr:hypothetical protein [Actinoplanes palleronii]GIE67033.1 hypothetical protein Apa02nite_031410 [Actinoplanes palleronii]
MPTGSSALQIVACIVISTVLAYVGGRVHQWYKHSLDRDRSFREGYKHAYQALFPLASRSRAPAPGTTGPDVPAAEPPRD